MSENITYYIESAQEIVATHSLKHTHPSLYAQASAVLALGDHIRALEAENRKMREALVLLGELAGGQGKGFGNSDYCEYCKTHDGYGDRHDPTCPIARARELLKAQQELGGGGDGHNTTG